MAYECRTDMVAGTFMIVFQPMGTIEIPAPFLIVMITPMGLGWAVRNARALRALVYTYTGTIHNNL